MKLSERMRQLVENEKPGWKYDVLPWADEVAQLEEKNEALMERIAFLKDAPRRHAEHLIKQAAER